MKKIIISSIAAVTLIAGTLTVMTINNPQDTQSTQDNVSTSSPEAVQSVIKPEPTIHTPEQVEAVVEPPIVPVEDKVVEPIEAEVIVREPTFEELVKKYEIKDENFIRILKFKFDRRIHYPEDHPLLTLKPKDMNLAEFQFLYFINGR